MYCKHCGKNIEDDSQYCKYCGSKLELLNNEVLKDEVNLKTKEEYPKKIEDSKIDSNGKILAGNISLKTRTAEAIVLFIKIIKNLLKDTYVTLLFYFPIYLLCSFVFIFSVKISFSENWFNDYYYYIKEESHGAVVQVGIIGFVGVIIIKYVVRIIKWAYRYNSMSKK